MRCYVKVLTKPEYMGEAHVGFGDMKYGQIRWVYGGGYSGEIEDITHELFVSEPKLQDPLRCDYWLAPGVVASVKLTPWVDLRIPKISANGVDFNPLTGSGF